MERVGGMENMRDVDDCINPLCCLENRNGKNGRIAATSISNHLEKSLKNWQGKSSENHDESRQKITISSSSPKGLKLWLTGGKTVAGKVTLMAHEKSRSPPSNGEIVSEIPTRSHCRRARSLVDFSTPSKLSSPVSYFPCTEHVVFSGDGHLCGGFGGLGIWI
ncbi:hypothetical protein TIFTF001_026077 [Ficus carica]|uniref:Uncharacterized protein n=1 Tax=Ficus carica TaxID=3494 RepID=A0AA88AKY8_FICCA|nr:hypothetical protein TIFTF001_026077 [Ficus carica]